MPISTIADAANAVRNGLQPILMDYYNLNQVYAILFKLTEEDNIFIFCNGIVNGRSCKRILSIRPDDYKNLT